MPSITKIKLTVGFLTATDPEDKRSWSGIHNTMYNALKTQFEKVIALGPASIDNRSTFYLKIFGFIHQRILRKTYNEWHSIILSKCYAKQFEEKLKTQHIDVIFAPTASTEIAYLNTSIPICYFSDTSYPQITNYYDSFSNFSSISMKESSFVERKAINNSECFIFPSDWAAGYATDFYALDSSKVFIVKMGANLDYVPRTSDLERNYNEKIKLFFLGVDWYRKGGEVALATLKVLINAGYQVQLTVCGCIPPETHPNMYVIPFLNKNIEKDREKLTQLFFESHIFFLPTRAECYGVVFCEANAFGLPIITTATGGVTSIIEEGINGYALPISASTNDYVNKIKYLIDNPDILKRLSITSREKYEQELNWTVWANKTRTILHEMYKNGT